MKTYQIILSAFATLMIAMPVSADPLVRCMDREGAIGSPENPASDKIIAAATKLCRKEVLAKASHLSDISCDVFVSNEDDDLPFQGILIQGLTGEKGKIEVRYARNDGNEAMTLLPIDELPELKKDESKSDLLLSADDGKLQIYADLNKPSGEDIPFFGINFKNVVVSISNKDIVGQKKKTYVITNLDCNLAFKVSE